MDVSHLNYFEYKYMDHFLYEEINNEGKGNNHKFMHDCP
jgi:hypothetical protein